METKFGPLNRYTSMDEVFRNLRRLYGQFIMSTSTIAKDGTMAHLVSIRTLVAGKRVDAQAEGTGNVGEVAKQAMAQLQLKAMEIVNSKEVKGIPGMIKPIARRAESLNSVALKLVGVADDECDDYNICPYCGELYDDCTCDESYDRSDDDDDEPDFEEGEEVAPGIKFVGKVNDDDDEDDDDEDDDEEEDDEEEDCSNCDITSCEFNPNYSEETAEPVKAGDEVVPGIKFVGTQEEVKASEEVAKEVEPQQATEKLCCVVAKYRGCKFCPECGEKL